MATILHSRTIPSFETCNASFHHDGTAQFLSCCIVIGLIISYLPQVSSFPSALNPLVIVVDANDGEMVNSIIELFIINQVKVSLLIF